MILPDEICAKALDLLNAGAETEDVKTAIRPVRSGEYAACLYVACLLITGTEFPEGRDKTPYCEILKKAVRLGVPREKVKGIYADAVLPQIVRSADARPQRKQKAELSEEEQSRQDMLKRVRGISSHVCKGLKVKVINAMPMRPESSEFMRLKFTEGAYHRYNIVIYRESENRSYTAVVSEKKQGDGCVYDLNGIFCENVGKFKKEMLQRIIKNMTWQND